jgi:hypothetical protein
MKRGPPPPTVGQGLKFPRPQDAAAVVYAEATVHRDNSAILSLFTDYNSLVFTRPSQLGKTTLFSLAELLFSKNRKGATGLAYVPPAHLKNSCYVLRVNFGDVSAKASSRQDPWPARAADFDDCTQSVVFDSIENFVDKHDEINLRPDRNASTREPQPLVG